MSKHIVEVNVDNFESEVADCELPVLVDFWAPWCGPCLALAPLLDKVANDYAGKVKVVKINIDESTDLARKYAVRSIPQVFLFEKGTEPTRATNATRTRIYALLEKFD